MKRISLMLALFLTLSFGISSTASGAIVCDVDNVVGLYATDTIGIGMPVTFNIRLTNVGIDNKVKGAMNGFQVYSPDGADWTITDYGPTTDTEMETYGIVWDLVYAVNEFSVTGSGADTLGFGGSVVTGAGIPDLYDDVVYWITVDPGTDLDDDGKTLCFDSSYFPPSGVWMWAYGAPGSFPPDFGTVPYCYTLYNVPDQNVIWTVAPTDTTGDHCDLMVLNYTVEDQDDPAEWDPPATFQATGPGAVAATGDWTCQYTYAPTLGDVGASIVCTLGAHDAMHV
ncbi:MAG: hypothetical protein KAW46_00835, partial [candidate division Zixibacteria bacterium]|nr:hypothetical protein [candidate division Zixibacteria bacterium]